MIKNQNKIINNKKNIHTFERIAEPLSWALRTSSAGDMYVMLSTKGVREASDWMGGIDPADFTDSTVDHILCYRDHTGKVHMYPEDEDEEADFVCKKFRREYSAAAFPITDFIEHIIVKFKLSREMRIH